MKKIVILGSNFAGFTVAMQLRRKLKSKKEDYQIIVVSPSPKFNLIKS